MQKNQVFLICQTCGREYPIKNSKASSSKFCSRVCFDTKHCGLEGKFWAKIDKSGAVQKHKPELGQCWEWLGSKSQGYGTTFSNGRPIKAHRFSWELHNGPIKDGLWVLHACDNRACVNPNHLFLGTVQDNVADMDKKGRRVSKPVSGNYHPSRLKPDYLKKGEENRSSKLTTQQVIQIRNIKPSGSEIDVIAKEFKVCRETIYMILRRAIWKHVA